MAQLNNTNTGEIITYQKCKESGIYYTIWENSFYRDLNLYGISKRAEYWDKHKKVAKSIVDGNYIEDAELEDYLALEQILLQETNFEISNDIRNWYIGKGSTGLDTTVRILIPNKAYDNALKAKDDINNPYNALWQVIAFATENINAKFAQITYNALIQYLEELLPEHRYVLEMYENDEIIIEERYDTE